MPHYHKTPGAKKRKLKSKAVTIAPGKRYYGPPELRPSTKYKKGGKIAQHLEKGGTLKGETTRQLPRQGKGKPRPIFDEIKQGHKGFIDIERAKFQLSKEALAKKESPEERVARAERLEAGKTAEPFLPQADGVEAPGEAVPETMIPTEKKSMAERLWGPGVKEWEQQQAIAREKYLAMSLGEQIIHGAETVGMAATFGGQLGWGIGLATTSAKIHLASQAAERATTRAAHQYLTDIFKAAKVGEGETIKLALDAAGKISANPKTATLFRNIMIGAGVSIVTAAYVFKEIYGSKAFAGFIGKEEALQATNFGFEAAMKADDPIGAQAAIDKGKEIANAVETVQDKTPYINVIKGVGTFVEAEVILLNNQQTRLDNYLTGTDYWGKIKKEQEGEEKW